MGSSGADRRSSVRHVATFRIRLGYADMGAFLEGYAVNISKGGIYVPTKQPKDRGTEVRFEILLKDGTVAVSGVGRVAWARKFDPENPGTRYGMGVQFLQLEGASDAIVRQALDWRARNVPEKEGHDDLPGDDLDGESAAPPEPAASASPPAPETAVSEPASPEPAPSPEAPGSATVEPPAPVADDPADMAEPHADAAEPKPVLGDRQASVGSVDDRLASILGAPAGVDRITTPPAPPDDWSDVNGNGAEASPARPATGEPTAGLAGELTASDALEAAALASLFDAVADPVPAVPAEDPPPPPPSGPALPAFLDAPPRDAGDDALPTSRLLDLLPPQGPVAVPLSPPAAPAVEPLFPAPGASDAPGPTGLDLPSWDEEEPADVALSQQVAAAAGLAPGRVFEAGDDDLDVDSLPTSLSSDSSPPAAPGPAPPADSVPAPEPSPEAEPATAEGRKSGFFGRLFGRKK